MTNNVEWQRDRSSIINTIKLINYSIHHDIRLCSHSTCIGIEYSVLYTVISAILNYYDTINISEIDWNDVDFSILTKRQQSQLHLSFYFLCRSLKRDGFLFNINIKRKNRHFFSRYSSPYFSLRCFLIIFNDCLIHLIQQNHYYFPSALSFHSPKKINQGSQHQKKFSSKFLQIKYSFKDENSIYEKTHHYMIKRRVKKIGNNFDSILSLLNLNQNDYSGQNFSSTSRLSTSKYYFAWYFTYWDYLLFVYHILFHCCIISKK